MSKKRAKITISINTWAKFINHNFARTDDLAERFFYSRDACSRDIKCHAINDVDTVRF